MEATMIQSLIGNLRTNNLALQFMFGGNATFTVRNSETTNRFTFKVKTIKHRRGDLTAPYFISVLSGPDNETSYTFLGTVWNQKDYKHSMKSRVGEEAQSVKVFKYVLKHLLTHDLPKVIEVWHEGICGRCGRKLTVPESIEHGFGPECVKLVPNFKLS